MLSNFIRRNGKRKGNATKSFESRSHQKSFSTSESSQVTSLVFDIHEESVPAQRSPLVELHLSTSSEEWFPRELLRSSCSPSPPPRCSQSATMQETHTNHSPTPSLTQSENRAPSIASRKKSIPAPIKIPDHVVPNVQIGQSSIPSEEFLPATSPPNPNGASRNPSSPSASENLSSISGTTLARALIASSFVLSSSERRSSRYRSGVARQDSATLPRASFFLSDSGRTSPIPPVPPVPAMFAGAPPEPCSSALQSGASTESEYPMSEAYITSPEMTSSSANPRRISRIQEIPSPIAPTPSKAPPSAFPDMKSKRKAGSIPAKSGVSDGPKTAAEVSVPMNSRDRTRNLSQGDSFLPSSDDYGLDEFDFLPPETLMAASPGSDSSASCIAPTTPPSKRDANHGPWKRKAGGLRLVRNGSKVSLSDAFASQLACGLPSASTSEHDYGELLNYDLTVSPESSLSSSSASAGYQTFPETPVVFSPLWSLGYTSLARSETQMFRRRLSSMKSAGRGSGRLHSNTISTRRPTRNDGSTPIPIRSQSTSLPRPKSPSPILAESILPPSTLNDSAIPEDGTCAANKVQLQHSGEFFNARPHPLAHVSSSSSYVLEEEALQALAKYSPSPLPSIATGDIDPMFNTATVPASVSPALIPLPESTDVSPLNSPVLGGTSMEVSSPGNSQPRPLKSLLSLPSPSLVGSSFLPSASTSPSPSLDVPLPRPHSPMAPVLSSVTSNELDTHFPSPSFIPPPPYHTVVSAHHLNATSTPTLSRAPSFEPGHQRSRHPSNSSLASGTARTRARSRPPLPVGPRKPSGPGPSVNTFFPGLRCPNHSASSVGSNDPASSPGFSWHKLYSAASKPPPKFQAPPPKWRALTLEAAQWTFTSEQLQEIVSQAIQQSSEGSALRFLKPDVLEGEIADEMQRLELQHLDVKAQYKALARKRWMLMGALAGHVEGMETNEAMTAARTVEELAEVLSALDGLADKMHDIVLQMAQLKSLRDVHNTSALAMALRKINALFVRQVAEKERLEAQVDVLKTERDEAWKHAEDIAQDYDVLHDRACGCGCEQCPCKCGDTAGTTHVDGSSPTGSKRSARLSAVRKSSVRQSQAGLRSRSRQRSSTAPRPPSLVLDDIPPVPRLRVPSSKGPGTPYGSTPAPSVALALAEAQREVYEMLGLSVPPSQASSRRRTISGSAMSHSSSPRSRPASESLDGRARSRQEWTLATKSVVLDDHYHVRPLAIARR